MFGGVSVYVWLGLCVHVGQGQRGVAVHRQSRGQQFVICGVTLNIKEKHLEVLQDKGAHTGHNPSLDFLVLLIYRPFVMLPICFGAKQSK